MLAAMTERPPNLPESISPTVTWQPVAVADVFSGLEALPRDRGHIKGRLVRAEGEGVETFVEWAKAELELAERTAPKEIGRHTTQAVGHAKRALDSLFNQYLRRDWLDLRLRERAQFSEKLALLRKRPGLWTPWRLIPRIIADPRDQAEHEHTAPSLEDAALAVEAAEAVSIGMMTKSDPTRGYVVDGFLTGGFSSGPWGHHQYFNGFGGPFALTWRGSDDVVRVVVGRSDSQNMAECIYCDLSEMTLEQHFDLLRWWDGRYSGSGGFQEEESFREMLRLAHLDQPA
jgi:hypothetical protein